MKEKFFSFLPLLMFGISTTYPSRNCCKSVISFSWDEERGMFFTMLKKYNFLNRISRMKLDY